MSQAEIDREKQNQANIELANAYRDMMGMFAWKHLKGNVMARIKSDALKATDETPAAELCLAQVAEDRGIRKCLDLIDSEINWILNAHDPITRKSGGE